MGQYQNIDLLLAPEGATGDPRSRFSIAARRSGIDGSPVAGRRAPLVVGVTAMEAEELEATAVEPGAVVTAVVTAGTVELPSSVDKSGRGDESERKRGGGGGDQFEWIERLAMAALSRAMCCYACA